VTKVSSYAFAISPAQFVRLAGQEDLHEFSFSVISKLEFIPEYRLITDYRQVLASSNHNPNALFLLAFRLNQEPH